MEPILSSAWMSKNLRLYSTGTQGKVLLTEHSNAMTPNNIFNTYKSVPCSTTIIEASFCSRCHIFPTQLQKRDGSRPFFVQNHLIYCAYFYSPSDVLNSTTKSNKQVVAEIIIPLLFFTLCFCLCLQHRATHKLLENPGLHFRSWVSEL